MTIMRHPPQLRRGRPLGVYTHGRSFRIGLCAVVLTLSGWSLAAAARAGETDGPADLPEWRLAREAAAAPVNVYALTTAGHLADAVAGVPERVYVPDIKSRDIYVIDPASLKWSITTALAGLPNTSCPPGT